MKKKYALYLESGFVVHLDTNMTFVDVIKTYLDQNYRNPINGVVEKVVKIVDAN